MFFIYLSILYIKEEKPPTICFFFSRRSRNATSEKQIRNKSTTSQMLNTSQHKQVSARTFVLGMADDEEIFFQNFMVEGMGMRLELFVFFVIW